MKRNRNELDDASYDESPRSGDRGNHKDLQLCRQAYRTLSMTLAGGLGDEVLEQLSVRAVMPAPDASRLLVCLEWARIDNEETSPQLGDVLDRLERVRPMLRREVARALARKRAPELEFVIVPPEEVES